MLKNNKKKNRYLVVLLLSSMLLFTFLLLYRKKKISFGHGADSTIPDFLDTKDIRTLSMIDKAHRNRCNCNTDTCQFKIEEDQTKFFQLTSCSTICNKQNDLSVSIEKHKLTPLENIINANDNYILTQKRPGIFDKCREMQYYLRNRKDKSHGPLLIGSLPINILQRPPYLLLDDIIHLDNNLFKIEENTLKMLVEDKALQELVKDMATNVMNDDYITNNLLKKRNHIYYVPTSNLIISLPQSRSRNFINLKYLFLTEYNREILTYKIDLPDDFTFTKFTIIHNQEYIKLCFIIKNDNVTKLYIRRLDLDGNNITLSNFKQEIDLTRTGEFSKYKDTLYISHLPGEVDRIDTRGETITNRKIVLRNNIYSSVIPLSNDRILVAKQKSQNTYSTQIYDIHSGLLRKVGEDLEFSEMIPILNLSSNYQEIILVGIDGKLNIYKHCNKYQKEA